MDERICRQKIWFFYTLVMQKTISKVHIWIDTNGYELIQNNNRQKGFFLSLISSDEIRGIVKNSCLYGINNL